MASWKKELKAVCRQKERQKDELRFHMESKQDAFISPKTSDRKGRPIPPPFTIVNTKG